MAEDRNRAPRTTIGGSTARATARSTTAPQRSGPDPLVELARLIGQNEGSAAVSGYDTARSAVRRRDPAGSGQAATEPRVAEPRAAAPRTAAQPAPPSFPKAPERPVSRGAEHERYPDQRYDGYADPHAPDVQSAQGRRSEPQAWRDPAADLADPYHDEVGWRPPRKRTGARPEATTKPAAPVSSPQDDEARFPRGFAEPPRQPRTTARTASVQPDAGRIVAPAPPHAPAPIAPAAPAAAAPRAVAARPAVAPALLDDLRQAYARYAPGADGAYEAGDYYDDRPPSAAGPAGYDRAVHDDEDAYNYGGVDYEDQSYGGGVDYEDQSYGGGRRKVWLAVALVALAVIGTGGAYAVRSMFAGPSQSAPPPVVHADMSPKKIAAARPGDKPLQDRVNDPGVAERMVSREETPVAIKDPNAPALVPGVRSTAEPPVVSAPATTSAADTRMAPGAGEPKRIRTVTIRPDSEPAEAAPAPSRAARNAPAAAAPAAPATARTVPPATPTDAAPQTAPAAPPPRARTATAAPPPRVNPGDYMVQLSAQRSEADARNSYRVLQSRYSSVLGGRDLVLRRKDLGKRGVYYGAQVGPFASRAEAAQLCENLKAAGGTCLVERN